MQKFFCHDNEKVMIAKVFDYIVKNSNINAATMNTFLNILCDNLGFDSQGFDEISISEFEDEFMNYFKNNSHAINAWEYVKKELVENDCELWI